MKYAYFLISFMVSLPLYGETITLQPGECVKIDEKHICSVKSIAEHHPKIKRFRTENKTYYGNITCFCKYGFGTPKNVGDATKGWWLIQQDSDHQKLTELINFGGTYDSTAREKCESAASESASCLVGSIKVQSVETVTRQKPKKLKWWWKK